jgi:hypothetical protein
MLNWEIEVTTLPRPPENQTVFWHEKILPESRQGGDGFRGGPIHQCVAARSMTSKKGLKTLAGVLLSGSSRKRSPRLGVTRRSVLES